MPKPSRSVVHRQCTKSSLALRPPADVSLLSDHRQKAADAFVRYRDAHDRAYQAFVNEQAVGKIAHATGQLAEDGKPLHAQAQQMRGPLEKSKGDEQQRQSTVAGAQTGDVKGADSRMGGLVMGLISKIGDNSDHLSQKPDGGGSNGGQMSSVRTRRRPTPISGRNRARRTRKVRCSSSIRRRRCAASRKPRSPGTCRRSTRSSSPSLRARPRSASARLRRSPKKRPPARSAKPSRARSTKATRARRRGRRCTRQSARV